jgi:Zn-dependent protease
MLAAMLAPNGKFYLGHLGRIPVYAGMEAILLLVVIYTFTIGMPGDQALLFIVAMLLSLLLHEFGHAMLARWMGMHGITITMGGLGGYCSYVGDHRPAKELLISLSGPGTNFLLAGLAEVLVHLMPDAMLLSPVGEFAHFLALINIVLGIFNILPIYPLDGGQALLAVLRLGVRNERTARRTCLAITVTALAGVLYWVGISGLGAWNFLLAVSLLLTAFRDLA